LNLIKGLYRAGTANNNTFTLSLTQFARPYVLIGNLSAFRTHIENLKTSAISLSIMIWVSLQIFRSRS